MVNCEICDKYFQYPSQLIRHYNAIRKCTPKLENPIKNKICESRENIIKKIKCELSSVHTSSIIIQCIYCSKIFNSNGDKNRHERICKFNSLPVIRLELKLGIPIGEHQHTKCKFCQHDVKYRSNYIKHVKSCKDRKIYEEELFKKYEPSLNTENYTLVVPNNFSESITISNERLKRFISEHNIFIMDKQIIDFIKELHTDPNYHNIICKPRNNGYVHVYDNNKWNVLTIEDIYERCLYIFKDLIKSYEIEDNIHKKDMMINYNYIIDKLNEDIDIKYYAFHTKKDFTKMLVGLNEVIHKDIYLVT